MPPELNRPRKVALFVPMNGDRRVHSFSVINLSGFLNGDVFNVFMIIFCGAALRALRIPV